MDDAIQKWEHAALPVVYFVGDMNDILLGRIRLRCGGVSARHVSESGRTSDIHHRQGHHARGCRPRQRGRATGRTSAHSPQGRQEMGDTAFP